MEIPPPESEQTVQIPEGLTPPIPVDECTDRILLWTGGAEFEQVSRVERGDADVFFDMLPRPDLRFEFRGTPRTFADQIRQMGDATRYSAGTLRCGHPMGSLAANPATSNKDAINGVITDWVSKPDRLFSSAKFLVINGPRARGTPISRGNTCFVGRFQSVTDNLTVTIDALSSEAQAERSVYSFTHVAEVRFKAPEPADCFEDIAGDIFRTLSLMKGRWVGLVGPWLYVDDTLDCVWPCVTKVNRNGASHTWCHDTISGIFEDLFTCLRAAYKNSETREPIQTGFHWLIESQSCAGGVEGSLILQQAALEALAWLVIVRLRKLCSADGFEKLPASDKIRWLGSIFSIPTGIPAHCEDVVSYAKAHNLEDLPAVLADVRNALVHGSPKKAERLFARQRGDDERVELWYLVGGVLEQAVLAIAGYRGMIIRRDVDAQWVYSAIARVPWVNELENEP